MAILRQRENQSRIDSTFRTRSAGLFALSVSKGATSRGGDPRLVQISNSKSRTLADSAKHAVGVARSSDQPTSQSDRSIVPVDLANLREDYYKSCNIHPQRDAPVNQGLLLHWVGTDLVPGRDRAA